MKPLTKLNILSNLDKLSELIGHCSHSERCECMAPLGVECTCSKEKAEDLCSSLMECIKKYGVSGK